MIPRFKLWAIGVIACLAALVLAAIALPQSFFLTAFSDIIQCLLLASGTASFIQLSLRSRGRMRLFWSLMALGIAFWFSYTLLWIYFEVLLRQEVPDLFAGDVVLFLHIVPMMAALALRPHLPRDEYAARLGRLDFALLLLWWVYLYVLLVNPWQYASANVLIYSRNLNAVYLAEKLVFLAALAACWISSTDKDRWKTLYANLFAASLIYSASSYVANWAISHKVYYSGSLYDIPLAASMAWITFIGLSTKVPERQADNRKASPAFGVWIARCGMIATFSLPLFAAWTISDSVVPPRVRFFRMILTLMAALAMAVLVFIRQRFLDRELRHLLDLSRDSFENLKRLQAQVVQSEKLASIGQLVGGAAHELNNPITAMLGYSDLLLSTQLTPEQHSIATKIGQHIRRTASLVASLLSFAKRVPAKKTPIDLNTLARTAVKLTQPQWQALNLKISLELAPELPKVSGDSNQLIQVCLQILGNALHVAEERGVHDLTISTQLQSETALLKVSPGVPTRTPAEEDEFLSDGGNALGLSACQGIIQEHNGKLVCIDQENGCTTVSIELPVMSGAFTSEKLKEAPLPVLWKSQPFA